MPDLLTHPTTSKSIDGIMKSPPHALLISGKSTVSSQSISRSIASMALKTSTERLVKHPFYIVIGPDEKGTIGIDTIRELHTSLKLQVPNTEPINRVVLIEQSDKLTIEAQNAMLALLEEPPERTMLILTGNKSNLLPTIVSRTQILRVSQPSPEAAVEHFIAAGYDRPKISQALIISGNQVELTEELLANNDHTAWQAAKVAKSLLTSSTYEKLLYLDELIRDRELLQQSLIVIINICEHNLADPQKSSKKWQEILEITQQLKQQLDQNAQTKLALSNYLISI